MPKPRAELATSFRFCGVAQAYRQRPPYPDETIELIASLARGDGARVIDLGAGEGAIARPLAQLVARVDAVEPSHAMMSVGQTLLGGDAANLGWHGSRAESFSLSGPFHLAVAGAAMHWFDLGAVCHRLSQVLLDQAPLALCDRSAKHPGLTAVVDVIRQYSRAPEHDVDYDVADELTRRGLWTQHGRRRTRPVVFRQSPQEHLSSLRSTSSLARELMTEVENDAFDRDILRLAEPLAEADGLIGLTLTSTIVWGTLT